eukprot:scaffold2923_cov121-Cylindrotheca_fusiformis.AAC.11
MKNIEELMECNVVGYVRHHFAMRQPNSDALCSCSSSQVVAPANQNCHAEMLIQEIVCWSNAFQHQYLDDASVGTHFVYNYRMVIVPHQTKLA